MSSRNENSALKIITFAVVISVVCGVGWVKNIIKLTECDFKEPYKAEIIHLAGIIPPVGIITGWINVGK